MSGAMHALPMEQEIGAGAEIIGLSTLVVYQYL